MRINIKTTRTTLTPALRQYIEDKLARPLEKFLRRDASTILDVELELTTKHHKKGEVWRAEINISVAGTLLRGEQFGESAHKAIDLLKDEIVREARNFKERQRSNKRSGGRALKNLLKRFRRK